MSPDSPAVTLPPAITPPPWGLLGTIAWGALGVCAWFAVQFAVIIAVIAWYETTAPGILDMPKMANDGFLLAFVTIIAAPAWIGVSVLAARRRKWRARGYLALVAPRRGGVALGVLFLAILLVASDLFTLLLGREVVPGFMRDAYRSAQNSGALALFFCAVVIVAPISEEIAFRGFLFRGLSASWLGVSGAIIATSAGWTAMHVQYDAFTLTQIFLIGLLLGWIRWASGSTLLTILLHMLANLVACIQAAIKVASMA
ncbi:MAG: CPBP family intramembrane metalloprotease [Alphaproteobacteria bacterium]|nr:MAG: CPBP family intramembrane metalloprotease [Alphaproteobacteria bacterium]